MFASSTKILVVDDMKTMRKVLTKQLADLGYKDVTEAEEGESAWKKLQEAMAQGKPFGLVISDWNMPKMKGVDLLKKVRSDAKMAATPFVMVTAEVEAESQDTVLTGPITVDALLHKPFKPEELREKLNQAATKTAKAA